MKNKELQLAEMNKFLKGVHMGGASFKDYLEKAQNQKLKNEFTQVLETFKRHEEAITHRIELLGGDAADTVGIMGMMGELFEEMKLLTADNDKKVLQHAIKAMEMGIKNGEKFIEQNKDMDASLMQEVQAVVRDYYAVLNNLNSLDIN